MLTLSEAKPGDEVIYLYHREPTVVKVLHVTPTGRIKVHCPGTVSYKETFDSNGNLIGGDKYARHFRRLTVVTSEHLQRIQNQKDLNRICAINWNCVSPEKIRAALKAIE